MRFTVRQKIFPLFVLFFALTITSAAFADDLPPIFAAIHPGVNAADLNSTFGDVPIGKSLTLNLSIEFDQLIQTDGFSGSPYMKLISSSCEGSVTTCVVVLSFTPEFISTDYGFINFSSTRCGFGLGNFCRGSVTVTGNGVIGVQPSPSPAPSPTPTPAPSQGPPPPTQKILLFDDQATEITTGTTLAITPSVYTGLCSGIHANIPYVKKFAVLCIDSQTRLPVSGCHYTFNVKPGNANGGHDHDRPASFLRPLGIVTPNVAATIPQSIPSSGTTFEYEAPEISQELLFEISGTGSHGEIISGVSGLMRVKDPLSSGFQKIELAGLAMNVASHTEGIYGTSGLISKLEDMLNYYFENPPDVDTLTSIESQGASLPWGGLLDMNQDWVTPHCGHRDGKTIDLGIRTLSEEEKGILNEAVLNAGLYFYYAPESPFYNSGEDPIPDHWHVQVKK